MFQVIALAVGSIFYATMPKPDFSKYNRGSLTRTFATKSATYKFKTIKAKSKDKKKVSIKVRVTYDKSNSALKKELKKQKKKLSKAIKKLAKKQKKKSLKKVSGRLKLAAAIKKSVNGKLKKGEVKSVYISPIK